MAIDQKARFGLGAATASWTSSPFTRIDEPFGAGQPGCATTNHVISTLKASAAQYGGRIRQALRRAKRPTPSSRHCERAGVTASENPDSTMNTMTAKRP